MQQKYYFQDNFKEITSKELLNSLNIAVIFFKVTTVMYCDGSLPE